jgi:hypothetical protein
LSLDGFFQLETKLLPLVELVITDIWEFLKEIIGTTNTRPVPCLSQIENHKEQPAVSTGIGLWVKRPEIAGLLETRRQQLELQTTVHEQ